MKKCHVELCGGPGDGVMWDFGVGPDDLPEVFMIRIQPPLHAESVGPTDPIDLCPETPEYGQATYRLKYLPTVHYEYDGES